MLRIELIEFTRILGLIVMGGLMAQPYNPRLTIIIVAIGATLIALQIWLSWLREQQLKQYVSKMEFEQRERAHLVRLDNVNRKIDFIAKKLDTKADPNVVDTPTPGTTEA